jgi:uncharacterized protein with HEPN domain
MIATGYGTCWTQPTKLWSLFTARTDPTTDRMLVLSLVKELEIIGEAANKVSAETRSQSNAIPWQDISGMRNRLIHAYFDVDLDVVWSTVTKDLPALKAELDRLL